MVGEGGLTAKCKSDFDGEKATLASVLLAGDDPYIRAGVTAQGEGLDIPQGVEEGAEGGHRRLHLQVLGGASDLP